MNKELHPIVAELWRLLSDWCDAAEADRLAERGQR